jgi:ABC-type nitrate/sulfonate/bicarbonate transport system substrate-binding protein
MKKIMLTLIIFCFFTKLIHAQTPQKLRVNIYPGIDSMVIWNDTIRRMPEVAKRYGINNLIIEEIPTPSSAMANDLLIKDHVDIITGAPSNGIILESKMPGQVKFLSGIQYYDIRFLCQPGIKNIEDARKYNIVLMQYFGGQHLFVKMLSKKYFGDATALEKNIIILPANFIVSTFQAKLSPEKSSLQCAVVSAPYVNQLMELGMETIETSNLQEGTGLYNAVWTLKKWADSNPKLAEAFIVSLKEAQQSYTTEMGQKAAMEYTIKKEKRDMTAELMMERSKKNNEIVWRDPQILEKWVNIIYEYQFIKGEKPKDLKSLFWKIDLLK